MVPVWSVGSPLRRLADRLAAVCEGLVPGETLASHDGLDAAGQRVDDRDADTVQTTRDRVAAAAELSAGMQDRHDDLDRGATLGRVDVDGDASAVVDDTDTAVVEQRHLDVVAVAGEGLVDRVVDHLVDEVVQTTLSGRADVHAGTLAHGLESFEDRDVAGTVPSVDGSGDVGRRLGIGGVVEFCHGWWCS